MPGRVGYSWGSRCHCGACRKWTPGVPAGGQGLGFRVSAGQMLMIVTLDSMRL